MKKNNHTHKELNDLYLYLDYLADFRDWDDENDSDAKLDERFYSIKEKYEKKFINRRDSRPYLWNEYYGVFKLKGKRIGIDPKRFDKFFHLSKEQLNVMAKRTTTYFHPKKEDYFDYDVNRIIKEIDNIKKDFIETYKPIIDKSVDNIKMLKVYPGDYGKLACGISGPNAAEAWARWENISREAEMLSKKFELYNSLYAQFIHSMTSRIEAVTVQVYSKYNKNIKRYNRGFLYNSLNPKGVSPQELPHYKFHDKLYCIWNFIKHNNLSTYEELKEKYQDVLIDDQYQSGDLAIRYLILNEKLIIGLLNGVRSFFIEWCNLILNEKYRDAQWNYDKWFLIKLSDEIEALDSPLGLEWWDDLD